MGLFEWLFGKSKRQRPRDARGRTREEPFSGNVGADAPWSFGESEGGEARYYHIESVIVEEAVDCPNCKGQVTVVRHPAVIRGECSCGAKLEVTERFRLPSAARLFKAFRTATREKERLGIPIQEVLKITSDEEVQEVLPGLVALFQDSDPFIVSQAVRCVYELGQLYQFGKPLHEVKLSPALNTRVIAALQQVLDDPRYKGKVVNLSPVTDAKFALQRFQRIGE